MFGLPLVRIALIALVLFHSKVLFIAIVSGCLILIIMPWLPLVDVLSHSSFINAEFFFRIQNEIFAIIMIQYRDSNIFHVHMSDKNKGVSAHLYKKY